MVKQWITVCSVMQRIANDHTGQLAQSPHTFVSSVPFFCFHRGPGFHLNSFLLEKETKVR